MSRGPQTSIAVRMKVAELVALGYGKTQIYEELGRLGFIDAGGSPSKSTIERLVDKLKPADPSGPWKLMEAEPDEAKRVFDVATEVYQLTSGRVWLTNNLAKLVSHVRMTVPDISPYWAYQIALAYQACLTHKRDSRHLDFALGLRPWESAERCEKLAHLLGSSLPDESLGRVGDSLYTLLMLTTYKGSIEDMQGRFQRCSEDETPEPPEPSWRQAVWDQTRALPTLGAIEESWPPHGVLSVEDA